MARHPQRYVLICHTFQDGTAVETLFPPADAQGERASYLDLVNKLNLELPLAKEFVIDDGGLGLRA
ncbi:hypothetical protein RYX56_25245, partial [Alkalihalophilus lindianensis]